MLQGKGKGEDDLKAAISKGRWGKQPEVRPSGQHDVDVWLRLMVDDITG